MGSIYLCHREDLYGIMKTLIFHAVAVVALIKFCEAQFGGGVSIQNCDGSNCNSNNFFGRRRRQVLDEILKEVEAEEAESSREKRQAVQNCADSNCNQNNLGTIPRATQPISNPAPLSNPVANPIPGPQAVQNCVGSNCNQNNVGGGGFSLGGFPSVSFPTAGTPVVTQQNCVGSNCNQNNLGKKKREILDMVDELTKEALDPEVDDQSSEREKREADPQIQNCAFSNCNKINFGRRKREVIAALLEELL